MIIIFCNDFLLDMFLELNWLVILQQLNKEESQIALSKLILGFI